MARATRRGLLGTGLLAVLAGITGTAFAKSAPELATPDETRVQTDMEADLLGFYRDSSPTEKAAILRLMERMLDGDDPHAIGVELMMAFGAGEEDAYARTTSALQARKGGCA